MPKSNPVIFSIFGKTIAEILRSKSWTLSKLAENAGVAAGTLTRYLKDDGVSPESTALLIRTIEKMGASTEELAQLQATANQVHRIQEENGEHRRPRKAETSSITVRTINDPKSWIESWLHGSRVSPEKQYDFCVFSYWASALTKSLPVPPPNVTMKVLLRNWVTEDTEESERRRSSNRLPASDSTQGKPVCVEGALTTVSPTTLSNSKQIYRAALDLREAAQISGASDRVQIRFYKTAPSFRGVLLRDHSGQIEGEFGFYSHRLATHEQGAYFASNDVVEMLTRDSPLHAEILDSVWSQFESTWSNSLEFEAVQREEAEKFVADKARRVWCADSLPYLLISRAFPREAGDSSYFSGADHQAVSSICEQLREYGSHVDVDYLTWPRPDHDDGWEAKNIDRLVDRISKHKGHVIFVCRHPWEALQAKISDSQNGGDDQHTLGDEGGKPVIVRPDGNNLKSPIDLDQHHKADLCLIKKWRRNRDSKIPDLSNGQGYCFLVSGLHSPGTWGGGKFMSDNVSLAQLYDRIQGHSNPNPENVEFTAVVNAVIDKNDWVIGAHLSDEPIVRSEA